MCKRKDFGNCDPETADQEYCIFHKLNKSKEEAIKFYRKFLERFKPRVEEIKVNGRKIMRLVFEKPVDARGFVFPKIPSDPIEYTDDNGNKWNQIFSFKYAIFEGAALFDNAIFEGLVCFTGAEFNHFASFDNAQFKMEKVEATKIPKFCGIYETSIKEFQDGNLITKITMPVVSFYKSKFYNGASFHNAIFLGITNFQGSIFEVKDNDELFFKSKYHHRALTGATFNRAVFKGAVVFSNSKFRAGAEFSGTQFSWADFSNAQFEGEDEKDVTTNFRDSVFEIGADFSNARFKGTTVFMYTKIHREAKFNKAEFKGSENAEVAFKGALLENAEFGDAKFYTPAEFNSADRITKIVSGNFVGCTFYQESRFYRVIFKGQTTFARSTFKDGVAFDGSDFGKVIFDFAVFEKGASFKNATFHRDAWFQEVEFKKAVEFQAVEFKGKITFKGSVFEKVAVFVNETLTLDEPTPKFHDELSFSNCDFRQGADFLGSLKEERNLSTLWDFFSSRFSKLSALIEGLRIQRLSFEKEGKRDEADRMFVLEMRAKRRARIKNARTKLEKLKAHTHNFIEWLLAGLPSEYGTNWVRLFLFSLLIIIGNAVPYALRSAYIEGFHQTSNYLVRFANALYYSLVTFTTLGYGDMHPTGWLKALSALEALTGAVFMALIVAVIARKWMR
ncbi:pentapeptide repeat-containing protein [Thermococcus sp.]|uniref:pentapeptide repeat-containing protein n=1 Tax=Thermococcus sp. TaxID=35749 RepID=UPI002620E405|nr:pentapeptide repeat-containing protein [Thermococcus sp.]